MSEENAGQSQESSKSSKGTTWFKSIHIVRTNPGSRRPMSTRPEDPELKWTAKKIEVQSTGRNIDVYVETEARCSTLEQCVFMINKWIKEHEENVHAL